MLFWCVAGPQHVCTHLRTVQAKRLLLLEKDGQQKRHVKPPIWAWVYVCSGDPISKGRHETLKWISNWRIISPFMKMRKQKQRYSLKNKREWEEEKKSVQCKTFLSSAYCSIVLERPLKWTAGCGENFIKPLFAHYERAIFIARLFIFFFLFQSRGNAVFFFFLLFHLNTNPWNIS